MEQDERDAETLRHRLYRPGASAADLAVYLRVAEAERPADAVAEPAPVPPGPPLRPFVIGGAVVAAAALLGAVLLTSGPPTPPSTVPATTATASGPVRSVPTAAVDRGQREHAGGLALEDDLGTYRYAVVDGDTVSAIAARFGLCPADVLLALPYGFDPAKLPKGESLELFHTAGNTC